MTSAASEQVARLRRELGIGGAVMLGLGSMIGTGVFVSIGIAASATGPSVIMATGLAALVAACNALSSAQLAASHAVAGGTYEYGYRYLTPTLGFTAGWLFLIAKSASAAIAALGFAGYALRLLGVELTWMPVVAVLTVLTFVALVLSGVKRSSHANAVTVLLYYAITNLAALRMHPEVRLYPRWIAVSGLAACLFLVFWVPVPIWGAGLGLIALGLVWRSFAQHVWVKKKG